MSGGISPLPQHSYMEWCSVKTQGQFFFSEFQSGEWRSWATFLAIVLCSGTLP